MFFPKAAFYNFLKDSLTGDYNNKSIYSPQGKKFSRILRVISETSFLVTSPDFPNSTDSTTWNMQFPANLLQVALQAGNVAKQWKGWVASSRIFF